MFYALRLRLENTSEAWLREYLERDGLDIMLHSLCEMTGKAFTSFSDAILQLDCVSCIRAILNTSVGLDFMVKHEDYTAKLILGLYSSFLNFYTQRNLCTYCKLMFIRRLQDIVNWESCKMKCNRKTLYNVKWIFRNKM